jgi:hypothetical protein
MPKVKTTSPPHRLSSLAHQRPPSPDVVVALALIPCPSASALACRHCHRCHHRQRWMRPANCRHPPPPPPREISLSRRTPFTIAVVNAAATATVANDNDDDDGNDGDRIPLPRSKLHHRPPLPSPPWYGAATIIASTKPSLPQLPPISSSSISCLRQSAITAAISCMRQTPLSSLVT